MAAFPTSVATDSDLYIAVNATSTQLTDNPLSAGATTVNVISTAAFPTVGFISIDSEIIKYTGKTGTSFTGCTRAADGTSAASHVQNSQIFHNVIAIHHNALKDDLIATEQFISDLIGRSTTQIKTPAGSVGTPSHSFVAATSSGLFNRTGSEVNISSNGTELVRVSQTNALVSIQGSNDFAIQAARILYLDGGSDTFIREQSANTIELVAGNNAVFRAASSAVIITSAADLQIQATKRLYLDGGGDTYILEGAANRIQMVTGGTTRFTLDDSGFLNLVGVDVYIASLKKLFLDGGGDTYFVESAGNVVDLITGGSQRLRLDNTQMSFVTTRTDTPGLNNIQLQATQFYGFRIDTSNSLNVDTYNGSVWSQTVQVTSGGDFHTTAWQDYGATSTIVGFSTVATKVINYKKIGKLVFVNFTIAGTSNATNLTFTLPFANAVEVNFFAAARDNGADQATPSEGNLSTSGSTVTMSKTFASGAWTNSGQKIVYGQFFYQTT